MLFDRFFKRKGKRYRVQCIEYEDCIKWYPQYKSTDEAFPSWRYFYRREEMPVMYEDWLRRNFDRCYNDYTAQQTIIFFSSPEAARRFIEDEQKADNHNVKKVSVFEITDLSPSDER